jgi:hypothetical protein
MKNNIIFCFLFLVTSCFENQQKLDFAEASELDLDFLINSFPIGLEPDYSVHRYLSNNDYPLELTLYSDNKLFYNLPRLGRGEGKWSKQNTQIRLEFQRQILGTSVTMRMAIKPKVNSLEEFYVEFDDRDGFKQLPLEIHN